MLETFTAEEKAAITSRALGLLQRGYLTGVNLVASPTLLPKQAVILHYLQDSQEQIAYAQERLGTLGSGAMLLPRETHYVLAPKWVKKPGFRKEYTSASFVDVSGNPKMIDEVIANPEGTFVRNTELDLLIPADSAKIANVVSVLQEAERNGPARWMDPAIIIKGMSANNLPQGFIRKDYISLARPCAEFYAVLFDEARKDKLLKRLDAICAELQNTTVAHLAKESVLWHPGSVNPELNSYMMENQQDLQE